MKYLLALIFPPIAVLLCGKPFQFFISILFTICFWLPGVIHALLVVANFEAENRNNKIVQAIKHSK